MYKPFKNNPARLKDEPKSNKSPKSINLNKEHGENPNIFKELEDENNKDHKSKTTISPFHKLVENPGLSETDLLLDIIESGSEIKLLSEPSSAPSLQVQKLYSPDRESFVDPLIRTFPQPSSVSNENLPRPVYIPENESFGNKHSDKTHLQTLIRQHYPNPEYKPYQSPVQENILYPDKGKPRERTRPSPAPGPSTDTAEETSTYTPFLFNPMQKIRNWFYGTPSPKLDPGFTEGFGDEEKKEKAEIDQLLNHIDTLTSPENPEGLNQLKNMTDTIINIIRKDYFQNEFKAGFYFFFFYKRIKNILTFYSVSVIICLKSCLS